MMHQAINKKITPRGNCVKAYVGPYFEFEIGEINLRDTPYSSADVASKLLAIARLRPKVFETGKEITRSHILAFIPKIWVLDESSISSDNVFHINAGSAVESQNSFYLT